MKYSILIGMLVMTFSQYGMDKTIKIKNTYLEKKHFKKLAKYALSFIATHGDRLGCQKNESGFVRINIPLIDSVKNQFSSIKKLRLNYWSPDTNTVIIPESIHSHPAYFESCIINGGYTHELYEKNSNAMIYNQYRIFKNHDTKKFIFFGESYIKSMGIQAVKEGDIASFPLSMIHRVIETNPQTLSLNVVFDNPIKEADTFYDVYLTKNSDLNDVKTKRSYLVNANAQKVIKEQAHYLHAFINGIRPF